MADGTRQYTNVVDGAQRIRALQSAVASGELSVDAARKAFSYGVGSNLDVLDELVVLFEARSQLAQTRLESLLDSLPQHGKALGRASGWRTCRRLVVAEA